MASVTPVPISLAVTPAQALLAWPRSVPVVALWSGAGNADLPAPEARWTILGIPTAWRILPAGVAAADARAFLNGLAPFGANSEPIEPSNSGESLVPGWFVRASYELGEILEPATRRTPGPAASDAGSWPLAEAARVEEALIYDHAQRQWFALGHVRRLMALVTDAPAAANGFTLGPLASQWGADAYRDAVRRVIDFIHAGDCYQVNLAHAMRARFDGSARALFAAMCQRAAPWHGAYMERDDADGRRAMLSISPELFLSYDASTRTLATRPMKGTRRADHAVSDLEHSIKDQAELAMIVDMMRNDLGRSAVLGSVRVDAPRRIERHGVGSGAILQATGLVRATLRDEVALGNAIADAFPPASVTGAPKIRAMQIIRELEASPRHAYCGTVGIRADRGDASFNVAIRTAMVQGPIPAGDARDAFANATLTYHAGAGIVADSDPDAEWQETLDKAGHIQAIARGTDAPVISAFAPRTPQTGTTQGGPA